MYQEYDEEPLAFVSDAAFILVNMFKDGLLLAHRKEVVAVGKMVNDRVGKPGMLWVYHIVRAAQLSGFIPLPDPRAEDTVSMRGLELMWDGIGDWRG